MEESALIEKIVDEVLRRIAACGRRALALFCGGSIGAPEARKELRKLLDVGFTLRAVLTPYAELVLGADWLRAELGDIEIITEASGRAPGALLQETDLILIPVLTLNTAAKVAHGIADTLVATLIMDSLLKGKPVFAARDACDPDHPVRSKLGMTRETAAYRDLLSSNLQRLREYGIRLVPAAELAAHVLADVTGAAASGPAAPEGTVFCGRVLSRSDVASFTGRLLKVSRETLVTPLARDLARDRGIDIVVG